MSFFCFFFNATAPTEIYTLSLHDALPICGGSDGGDSVGLLVGGIVWSVLLVVGMNDGGWWCDGVIVAVVMWSWLCCPCCCWSF